MKTIEQIKKEYKSETIDGRDLHRLAQFIPESELGDFGLQLKEGVTHEHTEMTKDAVLTQLKSDLAFSFSKALGKRGISAGCMYEVVKMWMYVLEDDLQNMTDYAQYGLPFFKAVAVKYGLDNPIGGDCGDEYKYSSEADY